MKATTAIVDNAGIVKAMHFPAAVLVVSSVLASLCDINRESDALSRGPHVIGYGFWWNVAILPVLVLYRGSGGGDWIDHRECTHADPRYAAGSAYAFHDVVLFDSDHLPPRVCARALGGCLQVESGNLAHHCLSRGSPRRENSVRAQRSWPSCVWALLFFCFGAWCLLVSSRISRMCV